MIVIPLLYVVGVLLRLVAPFVALVLLGPWNVAYANGSWIWTWSLSDSDHTRGHGRRNQSSLGQQSR